MTRPTGLELAVLMRQAEKVARSHRDTHDPKLSETGWKYYDRLRSEFREAAGSLLSSGEPIFTVAEVKELLESNMVSANGFGTVEHRADAIIAGKLKSRVSA